MKKLRKHAKELLHAASKVYHYRRDVISEGRMQELERAVNEVDRMLKDPAAEAVPFEAAMNRLDGLLRKIGGKIYPKTFLSDNLEVLLVAAILVIGVRTFFFQPFIIPTNSMYPTYSGMHAYVYTDEAERSNPATRIFRKLTLGASHYEVAAPASGEVLIPIFAQRPEVRYEIVDGRKWFRLLPAKKREYTLYVDNHPVKLRVPVDFSLDPVIHQTFFPEVTELRQHIVTEFTQNRPPRAQGNFLLLPAEQTIDAGEALVKFDITLGDALFVDRLSYHFRRPKVGEPFVFRTDAITEELGRLTGDYSEKYYIKRNAGVGGETLEIRDYALLVDGEPRDEVEAFGRNARREGAYPGYINQDLLSEGSRMQVPHGMFVALGDNSANSLDSRYWGVIPEESVIGKAFFIYYPFTKRWGVAE